MLFLHLTNPGIGLRRATICRSLYWRSLISGPRGRGPALRRSVCKPAQVPEVWKRSGRHRIRISLRNSSVAVSLFLRGLPNIGSEFPYEILFVSAHIFFFPALVLGAPFSRRLAVGTYLECQRPSHTGETRRGRMMAGIDSFINSNLLPIASNRHISRYLGSLCPFLFDTPSPPLILEDEFYNHYK